MVGAQTSSFRIWLLWRDPGRLRKIHDFCKNLLEMFQTCHPMWTAPAWDQGLSKRWPSILPPTCFMLISDQDICKTWASTAVHSNIHGVYLLQLSWGGGYGLLDTQTAEENASPPAYPSTRECPLMNKTSWPTWWHPYSSVTSSSAMQSSNSTTVSLRPC